MTVDRFDYPANLRAAGSYRGRRSAFWPPVDGYAIFCLDLAPAMPDAGPDLAPALSALNLAIETELRRAREIGLPARTRFNDPQPVADAMRRVGDCLTSEADRRAVALRADALQTGYEPEMLKELADLEEDVVVVAGPIATWYGKELGGLPTAFGCRRDAQRQARVVQALGYLDEVRAYFAELHADLRLYDPPAFAATRLFSMAGEGDTHPKHIAYFLPEDEGVKRSPFKKTYYFANTHRALLTHASAPLAHRLLDIGVRFHPTDARFELIPTLGVLGHELGHGVHRPATSYKALNAVDRWASVVLQEIEADVFGILVLADVWAPRLDLPPDDVVAYYLAECLRYLDRGLGHFPDSDGMFLQLSYFVQLGALALDPADGARLTGDPQAVLAALRSLARVLADAVLAGEPEPAVALHRAFGPATAEPMRPLVDRLRGTPFKSVEYMQEHLSALAGSAT